MTRASALVDSHGRTLRDLRVSLTDRCNFRCMYCLPETEAAQNFYRGHWAHLPNPAPIVQQWVAKSLILSFEEIELRSEEGESLLSPESPQEIWENPHTNCEQKCLRQTLLRRQFQDRLV